MTAPMPMQIVWLEDPSRYRWLREVPFDSARQTGRPRVSHRKRRLIGYSSSGVPYETYPGGPTRYERWAYEIGDRDVEVYGDGPGPCEAVEVEDLLQSGAGRKWATWTIKDMLETVAS